MGIKGLTNLIYATYNPNIIYICLYLEFGIIAWLICICMIINDAQLNIIINDKSSLSCWLNNSNRQEAHY